MPVVGRFTIPHDHPALPGHFPGRPIVPGVVLLDHAAALILAAQPGARLAGFPAVRFANPVRPGDTVTVEYADGQFGCSVMALGTSAPFATPVLRGSIALVPA